MSRSLAELLDSVNQELGDAAPLIPNSAIERFINEGQSRYEPEVLLPSVDATVVWSEDDTSVALPTDFAELTDIIPTYDSGYRVPQYFVHGTSLQFTSPAPTDFTGRLFYLAHFPTITNAQSCTLPGAAADGLVSYALYKCFKRIASSRTLYKRYSTLVNNQTDVKDLESLSENHFNDYIDARDSAAVLRSVAQPYRC